MDVETVNADVNLMSLAFNIWLWCNSEYSGYCCVNQISPNTNDQQNRYKMFALILLRLFVNSVQTTSITCQEYKIYVNICVPT